MRDAIDIARQVEHFHDQHDARTVALARALLAQQPVFDAAVAQAEAYERVKGMRWGPERAALLFECKKLSHETGVKVRAYLAAKEQSGG